MGAEVRFIDLHLAVLNQKNKEPPMKFTVLFLILTGFLAIPRLSHTNAVPIKNSAPLTTSHLTTIATEQEGKSLICHFVGGQGISEMFSVVIAVNNRSLGAHFAHGDCFTDALMGSQNCTCGPAITSLGGSGCCGGAVFISWTSTGGTYAVLEHLDQSGVLIESLPVPTNGSISSLSFTVSPRETCGHQWRLVITGPGGTVSQTILDNFGEGDGSCYI